MNLFLRFWLLEMSYLPPSFSEEEEAFFKRRLATIEADHGLTLKQNQIPHVRRLVQIADLNVSMLDTSRTGRGKSYTTIALALYYGLRPLVVTTATMVPIWTSLFKSYKVEFIDVISYQSLASKAGSRQVESRPLVRVDDEDKERNSVSYRLTKHGMELMKDGLLVFDEGQNMKNVSDKTRACIALAKAVLPSKGRETTSRMITLSASLFDKEENAVQICRVFGYISKYQKMYEVRDSEFTPMGILELIDTCKKYDPAKTQEVVDNLGLVPRTVGRLAFRLLATVIFPFISSRMGAPISDFSSLVYNGFFKLEKDDAAAYSRAVQSLEKLVLFHDDRILQSSKNYMGKIQPILINLEVSKLHIIYRLAYRYLKKTNKKVVICLNYLQSIQAMSKVFEDYDPQVLQGSVDAKQRKKAIDSFNTDPESRLLICTPSTGGVGVSLHDTEGNFPRVMLIVPTYDMIKILQAAGRVDREGKKSDSSVFIIYGQTESKVTEKRILDAITRKSEVLHLVNADEEEILPGDFPLFEESQEEFDSDLKLVSS